MTDAADDPAAERPGISSAPVPWRDRLVLRAAARAAAGAGATAAAAFVLLLAGAPALLACALAAGVGVVVGVFAVRDVLASATRTLEAVADGVRGFRDGDFSLRLAADRRDEIGVLVEVYNGMGDALRAERHDLYQRELLLDTVLQGAPVAIVLTGPTGRIVYANRAARALSGASARMLGHSFEELLSALPDELQDALRAGGDALVTAHTATGEETWRTARRDFQLNTRRHALYLVERLTPELRRREVEVWKNAIRVMNHELSNSLAPVSSLIHSAREIVRRPEHHHRLDDVFATVEERVTHLVSFLDGYARFARLPPPRKQNVEWNELLAGLRGLAAFRVDGRLPEPPGWFDAGQVQQVLINLVKNAHEAGSAEDEVVVSVHLTADGASVLCVSDRGPGMDDETLARALLPFYSSKPSGSGVGLALCQEIVESHGGRLRLQNRPGGGLMVTCWLPPRPA